MTTYPQVWFVDGPSEDANIRLDLNVDFGLAKLRVEHEGFTLGAPSLLGEPDSVSAALGLREPSWNQQIRGPKTAAHEVRTALSRELLRPTNWVRVRLDATSPVYYLEAYRGAFEALSLEFVKNESGTDVWRLPVSLSAEPLLCGERITLGPYTVTQSPDGDHPMRVVLPGIEGDAPTSLRVSITPASPGASNVSSWLVGCVAGTTDMADTVVDIGTGDTMSAGAGMAAPTTDADYFNGSYRAVTIAAATPNLLTRGSLLLPAMPVGRYNVQLRCVVTSASDQSLLFRYQRQPASGPLVKGPVATIDTLSTETSRKVWVDLGDISFPFGTDPPPDGGGATTTSALLLDMGTSGGAAGSVNIDALKLIPIQGPTVTKATLIRAKGLLNFGVVGTFDGDLEQYWSRVESTDDYIELATGLVGGYPVADPAAAQNLLIVMAVDNGQGSTSGSTHINSLDAEAEVTVSYHPRKLHI